MTISLGIALITLLVLYLWKYRHRQRSNIFTLRPMELLIQFVLLFGTTEVAAMIIVAMIYRRDNNFIEETLIDLAILVTVTVPFMYYRIIKPLAEQQNINIHTLTDNIPDAIIVLNSRGIITYSNPATEDIFGYTQKELKGNPVMMLMDEQGIEDFHNDMKNKSPSTPFRIDRQIVAKHKSGKILTAYLTSSEVVLNGEHYLIGIIKDITDLQNATEELRKTSAFLNAILDNIPVAVFAKNADDHRFVFWNKYSEKFFGLKQKDVLGKNDYDFFPKEQADFFWQKDRETLDKGIVVEIPEEPITVPDGQALILHTTKVPVSDEKSGEQFLLAISEDITERKKNENTKNKLMRIIKAINAINLLITKEVNAVSLLQEACRILIDTRDYGIVAIKLREPNFHNIKTLIFATSGSLTIDEREYLSYIEEHIHDYLNTKKTGVELNSNQLFNAVCSIPFIDNGLLVGTLFICSNEEIKFDTDELNMLRELAGDITFALHHIRDVIRKEEIENDLRETMRRLTEAQEIARIGYWEWDVPDDTVRIGEELLSILDITGNNMGRTFDEFINIVHPEDRGIVTQLVNGTIFGKKDYSERLEHRMLLPGGNTIYVAEQVKVYYDEDENPLKIIGVMQDITDKAMIEEKLKESEDKFRRIAEYAQDAMIIMNQYGVITYWNRTAEKIFGYTQDEVVGKELHTTITPPRYYEAYQKGMEHFYRTGEGPVIDKTLELTALRKNGKEFPVEVSISTIRVKGKWHAVGILRDITDRKLAEVNRTRLAAIVESSNDAIISKDMNNRITSWNKGAEMMYGYSAGEMVGESIYLLVPDEYRDDTDKFITEIEQGGEVIRYETKRKRKGGSVIDVAITLSPIKESSGHITGISTIARDITEQKNIAKELLRAKEASEAANKAKTEFLMNMSHEIRTPMNAILGMADMLMDTHPNDEQKQYIEIFKKSGGQLLTLINDILDLSKIEEGGVELNITDFDIYEILKNIEMMVQLESYKKGIALSFSADNQIPRYLRGDANKLNRIILNIVGNAVKFTPKGAVDVEVRLSRELGDEVELFFVVKDTGIGIPKEKLRYIFQRFSQADSSLTRQYGGTGLGLFISKRLLEMMGGEIGVESEPGIGSTFYFTVRLGIVREAPPPKRPTMIVPPKTREGAKKYNVLLVEDSPDNRQLIELYLKKYPYNIDVADNGEIAVEKVKQNHYDLVLMDLQMPVMDGHIATRTIREWEKEQKQSPLPIIALTANAFREDEEKSYAAGCSGYLAKPVKKGLLLETMNRYLEKNNEHP